MKSQLLSHLLLPPLIRMKPHALTSADACLSGKEHSRKQTCIDMLRAVWTQRGQEIEIEIHNISFLMYSPRDAQIPSKALRLSREKDTHLRSLCKTGTDLGNFMSMLPASTTTRRSTFRCAIGCLVCIIGTRMENTNTIFSQISNNTTDTSMGQTDQATSKGSGRLHNVYYRGSDAFAVSIIHARSNVA